MGIPVNGVAAVGSSSGLDIVVGVGGCFHYVLLFFGDARLGWRTGSVPEAGRGRGSGAQSRSQQGVCIHGLCLLGVHVCVKGRVAIEVFGCLV